MKLTGANEELALRKVLLWPGPASGPSRNWPDRGRPATQPTKLETARSAQPTVRIEIAIDASQVPRFAELLRQIVVNWPSRRRLSRTERSGALSTAAAFDLTPREDEILAGMIAGKSNRQIALELGIALATVKTHVSNVLSKMGVESRTEAAVMALQQPATNNEEETM